MKIIYRVCYLLNFSSGVDDRLGVSGSSNFLLESNLPILARRLSKVEVRILKVIGSMDLDEPLLLLLVLVLLLASDWFTGLFGFWLLIWSCLISSSSVNAFVGVIFFWLLVEGFLRLRNFFVGDLLRALARKMSSFFRKFFSWNVAGCGADSFLVFFSINDSARRASLSTLPSL